MSNEYAVLKQLVVFSGTLLKCGLPVMLMMKSGMKQLVYSDRGRHGSGSTDEE